MEPIHDKNRTLSAQMGAAPARRRPLSGVGCQIDIGNYNLCIDNVKCGELLVVDDPTGGLGATVEHWMLYSNFRSPSEEHADVSIQVLFTSEGADLPDFVQKNLQHEGVRYIIATCRLQS